MVGLRLVIVVPVFNDWDAFAQLIRDVDATVDDGVRDLRILAVDDGSTEPIPDDFAANLQLQQIRSVSLVQLKCNLGHQRAIAIGLAQAAKTKADAVVIMDADGEDRPQDIQLLIKRHAVKPRDLIAASRTQRSEGPLFRIFYSLYKISFRLLTGEDISFGNFSLIPMNLVKRLSNVPSLWNHFAATVLHSRVALSLVPCIRGRRYAGRSNMDFVKLVVHGLSAISVFSEAMLTRMLLFLAAVAGMGALAVLVAAALRLFTGLAALGWASSVIESVAIICLQALLLTMMSAFMVLSSRSVFVPPPHEHAKVFINEVVTLFPLGQPIASLDIALPPSQALKAQSDEVHSTE